MKAPLKIKVMEYFTDNFFSISPKPKATTLFRSNPKKAFSLMSETWQGCLLPHFCCSKLFWKYQPVSFVMKERRRAETWKRSKIIILELENPAEPTEKLLETVRELKREVELKLIYRNQYLSCLLTS